MAETIVLSGAQMKTLDLSLNNMRVFYEDVDEQEGKKKKKKTVYKRSPANENFYEAML